MKSLLCIVLVGLAVLAHACFADQFQNVYGWHLIAQGFDGNGGLIGPPLPIPCRRQTDYIKGAIATPADCWNDGEYRTLAECKAARGPKKIDLQQRGPYKLIGVVYFCTHAWSVHPNRVAAR